MDDPAHYRMEGLYSLRPLEEDLDAALRPDSGAGLTGVALREIWLAAADRAVTMHRHARVAGRHLLLGDAEREAPGGDEPRHERAERGDALMRPAAPR